MGPAPVLDTPGTRTKGKTEELVQAAEAVTQPQATPGRRLVAAHAAHEPHHCGLVRGRL